MGLILQLVKMFLLEVTRILLPQSQHHRQRSALINPFSRGASRAILTYTLLQECNLTLNKLLTFLISFSLFGNKADFQSEIQ